MGKSEFRACLILGLVTLFITALMWLPHYLALPNFYGLNFSEGFNTIYRNFDGIEYIIIAKSFYRPELIAHLPQSLSASYYAAHFPGFALVILAFSPLLGFLKSMLFSSLLFTYLSTVAFFFLIRRFKLSSQPLWLAVLFLVLPARWLIVHSVGSAEPMFIFFVLLSVYFFKEFQETKKSSFIWFSALAGLVAQLTRPPGILLFIAIGIYALYELFWEQKGAFLQRFIKIVQTYLPFILIPLGLLGVFILYSFTYHDFWAYFHSGDNIHLTLPPFQIFNKHQFWVGEIWLEDVIYILILGFFGGLYLWKKNLRGMGTFVLTYITATALVTHRDISRYALPIFPFLIIAFEKVLISKEFKIVMAILAVAFYLYAQNFLIANVAPIAELTPFN
ncbi:hypothetical protein A2631_03030 [Candidatus Daviesbacteria bacterium RIFCSPHIGHO2_01_FULL_44_29]|uniref:Glycosyltransferase RgtA/B/C/D-like domain-containing protein n=1 Tax=Candidatus Daviesbacteria bacterium RIFCSPHIGHO2_02_FULL_43_12 TaxID=1797776 RepID=A0A1F5KK90_9BACT|nr:MAG: hypothetical protein A2631_03030 [Candidatus Daviesbacteria bacterium RIFCSPHIGHO2_01_FULL_44_29]OGE41357.1 MAG: hypothetical protein A3D25_02425 [Candidatus Daviesbacteria bacterium RIFCSPHIGHO2_02_FULL_43_12]OGE69558.1 MAG: hypothetical protein A3B55_04170 [Candidatus Daviesbacteria bacterium RIFCSPLOWO2_01_FULL_43_15]